MSVSSSFRSEQDFDLFDHEKGVVQRAIHSLDKQ